MLGVLHTSFGDANLDNVFDHLDLTHVFIQNTCENSLPLTATWSSGDWNCDGELTSEDLVYAFREGGYQVTRNPHFNGRRPVANSIAAAVDCVWKEAWIDGIARYGGPIHCRVMGANITLL